MFYLLFVSVKQLITFYVCFSSFYSIVCMQFMSVLLNCLYAVYVGFTQLLVCISCSIVCISCSTVAQLYIDVQFICVPAFIV